MKDSGVGSNNKWSVCKEYIRLECVTIATTNNDAGRKLQ